MTRILTQAIVAAPNQRETPHILRPDSAERLRQIDATYADAWTVGIASPPARIAVAVLEPRDYELTYEIATKRVKNGRTWLVFPNPHWKTPTRNSKDVAKPKGTVLVVHGYTDSKEEMIAWALGLAQGGYRVVLVDLRGHGRSTGNWIGYGAFEVSDLVQVVDSVAQRGHLQPPLGVFGISYGASVSLEYAARDPRVSSVVALAPFSDPRQAIVDFAHAVVPAYVKHWTAKDFSRAEDRAAEKAHFSWSQIDVLADVARLRAPVLYVCTANDHWVPLRNVEALAANTSSLHAIAPMTLTGSPGIEPHVLLSWMVDPILKPMLQWFDATLHYTGPELRERLQKLATVRY